MGADVIVTIRMPASLTQALKERLESDHYADLSEQIRSVTRKGCLKYAKIHAEHEFPKEPVTDQAPSLPPHSLPLHSLSQTTVSGSVKSRDARIEALLEGLRELLNDNDHDERGDRR